MAPTLAANKGAIGIGKFMQDQIARSVPVLGAPVDQLVKRQYYGGGYGSGYYNYNSPWNQWGRWVALVCIILFVLFVVVLFSCVNARRRRRAGLAPRYGTGWAAGKTPMGHNAPTYGGQYAGTTTNPAPPYSPPVNNNYTGDSNHGYYGNNNQQYGAPYGQQNGIELQQPQNTYYPPRGETGYAAPEGPPPSKKHGDDGIIR